MTKLHLHVETNLLEPINIVFALGSLILYSVLYQSKLIPRFISVWGLIAAIVLLTGSVLDNIDMFAGISGLIMELIFALPIAVAEMILAIWLIVKGFNPSAIDYESDKTDTNYV